MNKVKVGVIGCGYWGPNLIRNFVENPNADVVGVADLREERLKFINNCYPQIATTQDYHELYAMRPEAVVIATPPPTHYPLAKEALQTGFHVLVEKPLTLVGSQADELVKIADQAGLKLMVGHTFEYNAAVHALRDLIQSGELGDLYYVDTARLNLGLFQRGLNVLWDLAPHDISILLYILGLDPISVTAQGMQCVIKGVHDVAFMDLEFPNNLLAHVHVSWLDPCKVRRVTVVGSKKMVVYNDIENEKIRIYDKGVETPQYTSTYEDFQLSYRYGSVVMPNIRFSEPLRQEIQHFLDCIANDKTPMTNGREGAKVVKILEAAQCSLTNSSHKEELKW